MKLNSFWFPDNYLKTALYFKLYENKDWDQVDPKVIMSEKYSSISGWLENINRKFANIDISPQGGGACGL